MFSKTNRLSQIFTMTLLAMGLLACEGEESTVPAINCGAGTTLSAAGDACEPNLSEGLSVNAAGEIVADTAGADTEAALVAAREEGRAEGVASVDITTDNQAAFDEGAASVDITTDNEAAREEGRAAGIASVTPLNCAEGTAVNEAGDACEPTAEYRAAAVEEGRAAGFAAGRAEGVASVTPLNCAEGTAENEAGDACEPTAEYRAAAIEEGRAAGFAAGRAEGVASVTPLNCAEGTAENEAGDACEPTAEYRAAAVEEGRLAGVASVTPLNCAEGTAENEAGDACEPNLSVDVAIDDEDIIVPTDAYAAQVCADGGGTFDAETGTCARTYDCYRGGYCSEAERDLGFGAEEGNGYAGDTLQSSGCNAHPSTRLHWEWGRRAVSRCGGPDCLAFLMNGWCE